MKPPGEGAGKGLSAPDLRSNNALFYPCQPEHGLAGILF
jgi:hypothetical protein